MPTTDAPTPTSPGPAQGGGGNDHDPHEFLAEVRETSVLPCEVMVAPCTKFGRGVPIRTVLEAIGRRRGLPDHDTVFSAHRAAASVSAGPADAVAGGAVLPSLDVMALRIRAAVEGECAGFAIGFKESLEIAAYALTGMEPGSERDAALADPGAGLAGDVRSFARAVLHGDDVHRKWLTEAAEAWCSGAPLPQPRGKGAGSPPPDRGEGAADLWSEYERLRTNFSASSEAAGICSAEGREADRVAREHTRKGDREALDAFARLFLCRGEGAALPGVEEIAEAVYFHDKGPHDLNWGDHLAGVDSLASVATVARYRSKATIIRARLAARGTAPEGDDPTPTDPADRVRRWVGERTGTWLDQEGAAELVRVAAGQAAPAAGDGPREALQTTRDALFAAIASERDENAAAEVCREADAALAPAAGGGGVDGWSPIGDARKDRTSYLLKLKDRIPLDREDLRQWDGLCFVGRHPGLTNDGFDLGWQFAAPVGQGGFPDDWFKGFRSLSATPGAVPAPASQLGA